MDYNYSFHKISYNDFVSMMMKWLCIALGLTAATSLLVSLVFDSIVLYLYPIVIVSSIVEIVMVFMLVKKMRQLSVEAAKKMFYAYSIINGITLSGLINSVAPGAALLAFALTCALFGFLYAVAKNTTYDFRSVGNICLMALPILIIGYIILIFIRAPFLYYTIVTIDLVVFVGLTLYDMKRVDYAYQTVSNEQMEVAAMYCAMELYLDFVNIFIDILSLIADNN